LFKKFRRNSAVARVVEEQLYGQVTAELDQGIRRAGLWGKAIAKSRGNENEALALYMQLRVQSLRDEAEIAEALIEEGHNQQEILDYEPANQSQAESLVEEELKEVKRQLEKEKQESDMQDGGKAIGNNASVLWIHILVWSIAGVILFAYIIP